MNAGTGVNTASLIFAQARERPGQPAIVTARGSLGFGALEECSARAAALLAASGVGAGDAVLVLQPMSEELYVALLALCRIGAVAVFLDPAAGRAHVGRCCALLPPAALIATARAHLLRLFVPGIRRIPRLFSTDFPVPGARWWRSCRTMDPLAGLADCAADAPALLTFTSGSTGVPKATARTHGVLLAQHRALARCLAPEPGGVELSTMPVLALSSLASGMTCVIPDADLRRPGEIEPGPVARQIRACGVTRLVASPALIDRMAGWCARERTALPGLRQVVTGGAPVFPRQLRAFQAMAPSARIIALYGSTEAEPIAAVALDQIAEEDFAASHRGDGLLAGLPVEGIDLRVLADRGGEMPSSCRPEELDALTCAAGAPGEVAVSGAHVLEGYLDGRGDRETKIRVGDRVWHRTGDAGVLDARGRLWLLGRCAARIDDARGRIYPLTAEAPALARAGVRRAALAAVEGRRVLLVQLEEPGDALSLTALREELVPGRLDEVRAVRRIPMDPRHNAKVDYPALRRLLGS